MQRRTSHHAPALSWAVLHRPGAGLQECCTGLPEPPLPHAMGDALCRTTAEPHRRSDMPIWQQAPMKVGRPVGHSTIMVP